MTENEKIHPVSSESSTISENHDIEHDDDERWAKAERMLAELKPGWTLSIARLRPVWCSGFLERLECSDDEPIDLDYIVHQWGGEILRLRLCDTSGTYRKGAQLNLRSYPPKFYGTVMKREQQSYYNQESTPHKQQHQIIPSPQAPPQPQLDIISLVGLLQKTRKEDLNTLRALLGTVQPQPTQGKSSIDELLQFATKFKQLQTLFGQFEPQPPPPPSEEAGFLGSLTEIAKALQQPKQQPKQQPGGRVVPPRTQTAPAPENFKPSTEHLSTQMSRLSTEEFQNLFLTALGKMSESKRNKVIQAFMEQNGGDEDDLDYDDEDDDDDEVGVESEAEAEFT